MPLRKAQKFQRLPGFFAPIFRGVTKRCQLPCQANSMDLYLYPRRFEPLFRGFFGKAARVCSQQNVEFEQAFLLVLLDRHSECMCHCVDTGKAQNTLSYLQSAALFLSAKKGAGHWFVKTNNPAPITLWKIFLRFFWNPAAAALWKRALTAKIPWIWKSRGSKPLPSVISSMELPKKFENKKLPNPLRWLAFSPFHL